MVLIMVVLIRPQGLASMAAFSFRGGVQK